MTHKFLNLFNSFFLDDTEGRAEFPVPSLKWRSNLLILIFFLRQFLKFICET